MFVLSRHSGNKRHRKRKRPSLHVGPYEPAHGEPSLAEQVRAEIRAHEASSHAHQPNNPGQSDEHDHGHDYEGGKTDGKDKKEDDIPRSASSRIVHAASAFAQAVYDHVAAIPENISNLTGVDGVFVADVISNLIIGEAAHRMIGNIGTIRHWHVRVRNGAVQFRPAVGAWRGAIAALRTFGQHMHGNNRGAEARIVETVVPAVLLALAKKLNVPGAIGMF